LYASAITLTEAQASNPDSDTYQALFEEDYTKLFGRPVDGMDVEITVWAVNATTPPESIEAVSVQKSGDAAPTVGKRNVFDPALSAAVNASIVDRAALSSGSSVIGPAVIVEDETTIILPSSRDAVCQPDGCIDVMTKG